MKVCTKCGWQNEDGEAKCFQCYADLPADKTKRTRKSKQQETVVSVEVEPPPQDDSANVWNDPDMRPIVHDTIDDLTPSETSSVRMIEEVAVDDEGAAVPVETESSGFRLPLWAVIVVVLGFVLMITLIGRSFAKGPESSPQEAVSRLMDAVVARDYAATRTSLSVSSQQIAGMAPLMLGTTGSSCHRT